MEISKGVCELCNIINKGCRECTYKEDYPDGYPDFRRQRRFECNKCNESEGYQLTKNGLCYHYTEFWFTNGNICIKSTKLKKLNDINSLKDIF